MWGTLTEFRLALRGTPSAAQALRSWLTLWCERFKISPTSRFCLLSLVSEPKGSLWGGDVIRPGRSAKRHSEPPGLQPRALSGSTSFIYNLYTYRIAIVVTSKLSVIWSWFSPVTFALVTTRLGIT